MDVTTISKRVAITMAIGCMALGILTPVLAHEDPGVRLDVQGDKIVVTAVNPYSNAASGGMATGDVVLELNGRTLIRLPAYVYGPDPTPDPVTGETPAQPPIGIDPLVVTPVVTDTATLQRLLEQPLQAVGAASPVEMASATPDVAVDHWLWVSEWNDLRGSIAYVAAGIVLLFAAAWLLGSGRAGPGLRDLGYPFALAISSPFLLLPLQATWSPYGVAAYSVLMPLSMLPLAVGLARRVDSRPERLLVVAGAAAAAIGAMAVGLGRLVGPAGVTQAVPITVLAGMAPLLPAIAAAAQARTDRTPTSTVSAHDAGVLTASAIVVIGATPLFAINTAIGPYPMLLAFWLAFALLAARFTVRPLARLASRAQLQRDLVVAATEAERARVAADIHDDALQELTMLVRRLDANGDLEGADMARGISDRLRAICGDLRLPILDDLGVGPALDWLVLRMERLAGGEVRLERADTSRAPSDVELAFFRVAQEALSNAVKHGATPIVVRYRATDAGVSLSVDDAGPGIDPQASARASDGAHFGLLNMQQRADAIGAILDVRRWPTGGTHVQLEWRPQ